MKFGRFNNNMAILPCLLIVVLVMNIAGCRKQRTEEEQLVVKRIAPLCKALEDYKRDNMYYPESWDELLRYKRAKMPINPYTGEPMVALDSKVFDPEKSPGNIYYAKVVIDEQIINCQVYLFGARGEITRYQHANPMVAK